MAVDLFGILTEIDLHTLIFKQLLGLQRCMGPEGWGCITGEFTHDFVFSLFLPHIILAVFLFLAFKNLKHKGLEALVGIGAYIFILQMGWYPMFASLTLVWLAGAILLGFFYFVVGKFISPGKGKAHYKAGKELRKRLEDIMEGRDVESEIRGLYKLYEKTDDPEKKKKILETIEKLKERR